MCITGNAENTGYVYRVRRKAQWAGRLALFSHSHALYIAYIYIYAEKIAIRGIVQAQAGFLGKLTLK